jgi:hypothetical protein
LHYPVSCPNCAWKRSFVTKRTALIEYQLHRALCQSKTSVHGRGISILLCGYREHGCLEAWPHNRLQVSNAEEAKRIHESNCRVNPTRKVTA